MSENDQKIQDHFSNISKLTGISVERLTEMRSKQISPTYEETVQLAKGLMDLDMEQLLVEAGLRGDFT